MTNKRSSQLAPKTKITPSSSVPAPFQPAPTSLQPLLNQCDPAKVYIVHIDRLPPDHKRNIFLIPVILNASIAILLLWRAYTAAPTYWALVLALVGYPSPAAVDTKSTPRNQQIFLVLRRAAILLCDFALFRLVGPWPLTFFAEWPSNPVLWRWKLGFRSEEVIVRVSRGWGSEELVQGAKRGEESAWFKTRIVPAVDKELMRKTGYLMMDRSWDLDFQLMLDTHTLLERKELATGDIDEVVLAHGDGTIGWVCWRWQSEKASDAELRKTLDRLRAELATG